MQAPLTVTTPPIPFLFPSLSTNIRLHTLINHSKCEGHKTRRLHIEEKKTDRRRKKKYFFTPSLFNFPSFFLSKNPFLFSLKKKITNKS